MEIVVGLRYKNRWDEVVEISEISDDDVCFIFVDEGYVDVMLKEDFEAYFKLCKNGCK